MAVGNGPDRAVVVAADPQLLRRPPEHDHRALAAASPPQVSRLPPPSGSRRCRRGCLCCAELVGRPQRQGLRACPCGGGACVPGRFGCAAAQDQLPVRVVEGGQQLVEDPRADHAVAGSTDILARPGRRPAHGDVAQFDATELEGIQPLMSGGSWLHWRRRRGRLRLGPSAEADGRRGDAFRRPAERPSQAQEHRVNVLGSGMTRRHFSLPAGVRLCRAQAPQGRRLRVLATFDVCRPRHTPRPFAPKAGRGLEAESATHNAPRPGCRPEAPRWPCLP